MGPLSETGLAAIQGLSSNPAGIYFWTGFERLVALGLHIALSVLVYVSVKRRDNWFWFPAAILLHTLVDMVTILTAAWLPIAATEGDRGTVDSGRHRPSPQSLYRRERGQPTTIFRLAPLKCFLKILSHAIKEHCVRSTPQKHML